LAKASATCRIDGSIAVWALRPAGATVKVYLPPHWCDHHLRVTLGAVDRQVGRHRAGVVESDTAPRGVSEIMLFVDQRGAGARHHRHADATKACGSRCP